MEQAVIYHRKVTIASTVSSPEKQPSTSETEHLSTIQIEHELKNELQSSVIPENVETNEYFNYFMNTSNSPSVKSEPEIKVNENENILEISAEEQKSILELNADEMQPRESIEKENENDGKVPSIFTPKKKQFTPIILQKPSILISDSVADIDIESEDEEKNEEKEEEEKKKENETPKTITISVDNSIDDQYNQISELNINKKGVFKERLFTKNVSTGVDHIIYHRYHKYGTEKPSPIRHRAIHQWKKHKSLHIPAYAKLCAKKKSVDHGGRSSTVVIHHSINNTMDNISYRGRSLTAYISRERLSMVNSIESQMIISAEGYLDTQMNYELLKLQMEMEMKVETKEEEIFIAENNDKNDIRDKSESEWKKKFYVLTNDRMLYCYPHEYSDRMMPSNEYDLSDSRNGFSIKMNDGSQVFTSEIILLQLTIYDSNGQDHRSSISSHLIVVRGVAKKLRKWEKVLQGKLLLNSSVRI